MQDYHLEGRPFVELNVLLKYLGWCESGGSAKAAVAEGNVKVNGEVELRKRCKLTEGNIVEYNGQSVRIEK